MDRSSYLSEFKGTGERNKDGLSLEEFLESYNPKLYDTPANTVDMLVFSYEKKLENSKLLLVKRSNHPSIGFWALPGGFVEMEEDLEAAAMRELKEETGVSIEQIEQIAVYGAVHRDPRMRIITTAYMALIEKEECIPRPGDDAADAAWFDIKLKLIENKTRKVYKLLLSNLQKEAFLEAEILCIGNVTGFLRKKKFEVIRTKGLAGDHPAIITEGILYMNKLKEQYANE